ncbi:MAG TPA: hypothetical protein VES67_09545 [Vicinamibacterales bacterium]|nr:hypothetical protein [Vicinamibacterales bacterium]
MSANPPSDSIAPTPSRMLPLLVIVPIVVATVRLGRPHYLETETAAIGFTLLCAGVFGLPALFWALDHARTRLAHLTTLGVIAGILAPIAVLLAGALGQLQYGGLAYVRRVLARGATLPWYGMLPWPQFAGLAATSAIAGAVSATVYWLLFVHRRPSLATSVLISAGVIAAGAGVAMLLP